MENLTIIETRIKNLRERIGYTQKELATKLGVTRSLICLWEQGYANISLKQLIKIASIYQVSIDYLLGLTDKKTSLVNYEYISDIDLKILGQRLKNLRKQEKLTQDKFAKKIDTKRSSISYYEIGKMMISTADLKQICETFGISADYLTGNTNDYLKIKKKQKLNPKKIKEVITN